jgi:diketogulonate reductase-like aldo/keto reductase
VGIAEKHGKTPAQVLLRYSLQRVCPFYFIPQSADTFQGYVAIPKSVSKERIVANKEIYDFELSEEEMEKLYGLDECESSRYLFSSAILTCW